MVKADCLNEKLMAVLGLGSQAEKGSMPVSGAVESFALAPQNSHWSQPTRSGKRRNGGLRTHRVSCVTRGWPKACESHGHGGTIVPKCSS
jgi:hypothetical protein